MICISTVQPHAALTVMHASGCENLLASGLAHSAAPPILQAMQCATGEPANLGMLVPPICRMSWPQGSWVAAPSCYVSNCLTHLLFILVLATARISVPCISRVLISSRLCTCFSVAPAKLTPLGSSRMVTTGRGATLLLHSRSRTSSCKHEHARYRHGWQC